MNKTEKELREKFELCICKGIEGYCIYLNDFRIAGNKPWGRGKNIKTWQISLEDIEQALNEKIKKEGGKK